MTKSNWLKLLVLSLALPLAIACSRHADDGKSIMDRSQEEAGESGKGMQQTYTEESEPGIAGRDLSPMDRPQVMSKPDINTMSLKDFEQMGLDSKTAENVIRYRDQHGNFKNFDELKKVPGMNRSWMKDKKDKMTVS